jgi:hypothetical protein
MNGSSGRSALVVLALAFVAVLVQQRGPLIRYLKIEKM